MNQESLDKIGAFQIYQIIKHPLDEKRIRQAVLSHEAMLRDFQGHDPSCKVFRGGNGDECGLKEGP